MKTMLSENEAERKKINCFDMIQKINVGYEDGVIDIELYSQQKLRILWILKETNGNFSPVKYFNSANSFKGNKWKTWKNVARVNSLILNGKDCKKSNKELLQVLRCSAILNLKKSPGKASTKMKKYSLNYKSSDNADARKIILEQINNIKPNIIICGNVMNLLRWHFEKENIVLKNDFCKRNIDESGKQYAYYFNNVIFINAYHPCYPTRRQGKISSDCYCKVISNAVADWRCSNKSELPIFIFKNY